VRGAGNSLTYSQPLRFLDRNFGSVLLCTFYLVPIFIIFKKSGMISSLTLILSRLSFAVLLSSYKQVLNIVWNYVTKATFLKFAD